MFGIDIVQQNLRDQAQGIVGEANISVGGDSSQADCYHRVQFAITQVLKDTMKEKIVSAKIVTNCADSSRSCPS